MGSDRLHMAGCDRLAQCSPGKRAVQPRNAAAGWRPAGRRRAFRGVACLARRRRLRVLDVAAAGNGHSQVRPFNVSYATYHLVTVTRVTQDGPRLQIIMMT